MALPAVPLAQILFHSNTKKRRTELCRGCGSESPRGVDRTSAGFPEKGSIEPDLFDAVSVKIAGRFVQMHAGFYISIGIDVYT